MQNNPRISERVMHIQKSAIHEMTRLSKEVEGVAFLSWAKPTSDTPEHIKEGAISAIKNGFVSGYSESSGLLELREQIAKKLKRDNNIDADVSQILVTVGAIEGLSAAMTALIGSGDEAYEYFTYDGNKHFSIASIPEMKKNVVSCFTFTKTYAMTGWRVGYLHADELLIPQITKAHIPLAICAPVVSQYAALAALKGSQDCVAKFRAHYLSARNLMCERLKKLASVFEYQKPGGSYLMFPKILLKEGADSMTFCKKLLREAKVSTTPGIAFGPTGEAHLRLSFCVSKEEINKAFDRMENYFG